ncbi:hypothetical protein [Falsiroseomonas sp. HW251]|uniref:hypothetical protein n=1 Tax=Falsiroseomonas sp. HW251 TaxID=3390998 RepID=UPI003D313F90
MRSRLPAYATAGVMMVLAAGALAQAEAERRLDAAIERLRASLGPGGSLVIGGRRVDPVTGRSTLTDVVLSQGTDRLSIPELLLTDVTDTRIGRAEAVRIRHEGADGSAGQAQRVVMAGVPIPVAGKPVDWSAMSADVLEIEGAQGQSPGNGRFRLDRLALRDARRSGLGSGTLEGLDFAGAGPNDGQVFRLGRVALEALTLPLSGDAFDPLAFRASRLAAEAMDVRDPRNDVTVALGRLALQDWVPGRLTSLAIEQVRIATPTPSTGRTDLSVARIAASGIDAAGTVAALVRGVQVPDPLPGTSQRLAMEGLEMSLEGQPVAALTRFSTGGGLENGRATGAMALDGLRVTPPRGQAPWLEELGYTEVAGGLELRGSANRGGGRLEIAPLRVEWLRAATLSLSAQLEGMPGAPPPGSPVNPDAMMAELAAARLADATITLRDQGLLGRILAQQARQQRVPEARLRDQWAQMVLAMPLPGGAPSRGQAAPGKGPAAADPLAPARQALASFIRQPGTLEISLRPPKPIGMAELGARFGGDPAGAIQQLGLTVTAR